MTPDAWITLGDVLNQFLPLVTFAIAASFLTYYVFVVLLGRPSASKTQEGDVPISADANLPEDFGLLLGPSYVLMASLFGMVFGILISMLGGFSSGAATGSPAASIVAGVGVVVAVVGSLFVESGRIPLRRPIGAIVFLLTFVVAGLYWAARI